MAYTTINKSSDFFTTATWSGTSSQQTISLPFQADWIWVKRRNSTVNHASQDIVNAFGNRLSPNRDVALGSEPHGIGTVDANGFNFKGSYNGSGYNESGGTYVSWNWKAGNSQGSSNTDGSINTTYTSVNTTAGFSISTYTGTGSNATVGHGLGSVPKMIIVKRTNATDVWRVYHSSIGATKHLVLNTTAAEATGSNVWNDTAPTSSVFSISTDSAVNASGATYVAYCFAEKTGYSKFGSYVGNGNVNGTFVYTGFKPAFVMLKETSNADNWLIMDNKRLGYNPRNELLFPNLNNAEQAHDRVDLVSNGFKMNNDDGSINTSGATYIYMAFGQSIVGSNNVPGVAR